MEETTALLFEEVDGKLGNDDSSYGMLGDSSINVGSGDIKHGGDMQSGSLDGSDVETEKKPASLFSCIFNLTNSMIGSGILSLPYGFASAGLVTSIILLFCYSFFTALGTFGVFMACRHVEKRDGKCVRSYIELVSTLLGKIGKYVVEFLVIFELIGATIVAYTVIGDCSTPFVQYFFCQSDWYFFCERKVVMASVLIVLYFPLVFVRKIDTFKYFSFLSVVSTAYIVIMVVISSIISLATEKKNWTVNEVVFNDELMYSAVPRIFTLFPMMCFGYSCQHIVPNIYYEMKRPTPPRMLFVSLSYFILGSLLYGGVAVFGFLQFLNKTNPDILVSYSFGYVPAMIARLAYLLQLILTAPLWFNVLRQAVSGVLCRCVNNAGTADSTVTFMAITFSQFFITLMASLFVPGIDIGIGFTASLLTVSIVVIFPGLIWFGYLWELRKENWMTKIFYCPFFFPPLYVIVGVFIIIAGTTITTLKTIKE